MRKSNTQTIASVIKDYLKEAQIEGKLKEVQVVNSWEELVGKVIARRTNRIYRYYRKDQHQCRGGDC
jgi:hypothetical protein